MYTLQVTRQGIGYILGEPRSAALYRSLAEEGVEVARAHGLTPRSHTVRPPFPLSPLHERYIGFTG